MIAVDTNILVYAHREDSPWHDVEPEYVKDAGGEGALKMVNEKLAIDVVYNQQNEAQNARKRAFLSKRVLY